MKVKEMEVHMTMLETRKMEQGKGFRLQHWRLEPGGSRIPQLPLLDMQVLAQGGLVRVWGCKKVVALACNEVSLCTKMGGAMVLACSEVVVYTLVWVLSGKWAYTWA